MQTIWEEFPELDDRLAKMGFESIKELQTLQDKFSEATKAFLFCMNSQGEQITELSGVKNGADKLYAQIGSDSFAAVFRELAESLTEEQIVEDTGIPGVKIAGQRVRIEGRLAAAWMLFAVIEEEAERMPEGVACAMTEDDLYHTLDFLHTVSQKIAYLGYKYRDAQAEKLKNRFSEEVMTASLRETKAVTDIVQMLESEADTELVLQSVLQIAGAYLGADNAQVFRIRGEEAPVMDVLAEWLADGVISAFDQTRNLSRLPLFRGEKLITVSDAEALPTEQQTALKELHIRSMAAMPILIDGEPDYYICFAQAEKQRSWNVKDIKFITTAAGIARSILDRKRKKNSLTDSYSALESILDHTGSALYVCDKETGELLFANKLMKKIFKEELENGTLADVLETALTNGRGNGGSYELHHEAQRHWYDLHFAGIRWIDGRMAALYALYDVSDRKVYQKRIEQQAYTDFLTGLYNRMRCERDLAFQIDEAKKNHTAGALMYLDLDDFKHINEGLGHQYGDTLLKAISYSLRRIEGIDDNCYRVGGDEFIVIVPTESYGRLDAIIEEVKEIFSSAWFLGDADYYCTMSMGIVTFPDYGNNVQDLIKKADIAMYEAKNDGKNRVAYYSERIEVSSNKRLDMEKNMRDATVGGYDEFEVYYQPIIEVDHSGTGKNVCCGAEALIRWNSTEMGFISPADFIPLAEYLGLITPIGNHVLTEACRQCKQWNDSGYPHYKVNVNLSVVQLLQPDVVENIKAAIEETGIDPKNLTLEVTESLAINDMDRMKDILGRIRALGARIALDDFGTGYSSLNHIRQLPFDVIKIDQSFVKDLAEDHYSQAFVRMVTELADAICVHVCVEGIETKAQYDVVKEMPVTMIQGYYFDKPMNAAAFDKKYVAEKEGA